MDKVNALVPDDPLQLAFIGFQHQRVLGFGIHAEQLAAELFELAFKPPAAAGQQRPAARLHDGFGHFQHGAFHTACGQFGGDLQDGLAGHVGERFQVACHPFA